MDCIRNMPEIKTITTFLQNSQTGTNGRFGLSSHKMPTLYHRFVNALTGQGISEEALVNTEMMEMLHSNICEIGCGVRRIVLVAVVVSFLLRRLVSNYLTLR